MNFDIKTYYDYDSSTEITDTTVNMTDQKKLKIKLKSGNCKSMKTVLESSRYYDLVELDGIELEAVAPFKPRVK